jgi:hypothetical protein
MSTSWDGRIRFNIPNKQKEEENNVLSPQNKCLRKEINGNSKIWILMYSYGRVIISKSIATTVDLAIYC